MPAIRRTNRSASAMAVRSPMKTWKRSVRSVKSWLSICLGWQAISRWSTIFGHARAPPLRGAAVRAGLTAGLSSEASVAGSLDRLVEYAEVKHQTVR